MDEQPQKPEPAVNKTSRVLVLTILGIIIALFLIFLLLRPRGTNSAAPQSKPSANLVTPPL